MELEVEIFVDNKKMIIEYGGGRDVVLELSSDEEEELVRTLLKDVNLWAAFVNSLSAAILQHK